MRSRLALASGLALALATAGAGAPGQAHVGGSTGYAAIAVEGASIRYSLTLWPATLPPATAEEVRRARAGDGESRDRLLAAIRTKVTLAAQGGRCEPGGGSLAPPSHAADSATLTVEFACAEPVRELRVRDDIFDVFGADHHTIARIDAPGATAQLALAPDTREARVSLAPGGGGTGLGGFVWLGVMHILGGWDHLLFLLALLLHGGGLLAMAKIVTAFTLAHSVTLSLAVLDVVVLPERLVEAVIALSIAAVAAENLFLRPTVTRRWIVSFCFGLVHGFGFSTALRELGLPADGVLAALVGFNVGVEVGQGLVVALALPALALLRTTHWERRMVRASSAAILRVGLVLLIERALL